MRSPGEVYLVLTPVGGWDDFSVLFHEGGHTEHFANVDPGLAFEFRYLGDNSITEAFGSCSSARSRTRSGCARGSA